VGLQEDLDISRQEQGQDKKEIKNTHYK